MNDRNTKSPATTCVHAGTYRDDRVGGVNTPLYASSSFLHDGSPGLDVGYPRYHTIPTQAAAAEKIAVLEGAEAGLVAASGLAAASSTLMALLDAGDHAVFQADIYGGTHHLAAAELPRLGISCDFVRSTRVDDLMAAVRPETKLLYVESPANPLMNVVDLAGVAAAARTRGLTTVIDNTFATPINQNPIALGFDLVIHSGTKYLNGHSDLCCGAIVGSEDLIARVRERLINFGGALPVFDAWLLERGMKTLAVRMAAHNANGQALAECLAAHPLVTSVRYPGLPADPDHGLAAAQMRGFGGMLAFELDCDATRARRIVAALEIITPAVSLGGVESLICFPATTSHEKMDRREREALGITDSLLRISAGIEEAADLVADLEQALETT